MSSNRWAQSIVELDAEARSDEWAARDIERLWRVHDLMAEIFSGVYRGSGRPFINHLAGCASLALRHGGDVTDVLAALAHAAYADGEFGRFVRGASPSNRLELGAVLDGASEAVVLRYKTFDWPDAIRRTVSSMGPALTDVEKRIVNIRIVNKLDDSLDSGVYGAAWRARYIMDLKLGAEYADHVEMPRLAAHIRAMIAEIGAIPSDRDAPIRNKGSFRIIGRDVRARPLLALARLVADGRNKFTRKMRKKER